MLRATPKFSHSPLPRCSLHLSVSCWSRAALEVRQKLLLFTTTCLDIGQRHWSLPYFFLKPAWKITALTNLVWHNFRRENCGDERRSHLGRIPPEISNSKCFFGSLKTEYVIISYICATDRPPKLRSVLLSATETKSAVYKNLGWYKMASMMYLNFGLWTPFFTLFFPYLQEIFCHIGMWNSNTNLGNLVVSRFAKGVCG